MRNPNNKENQSTDFDSIIEYYDHSWFDYSYVWATRNNLAIHFGYYDEDHNTHDLAVANLNRVLAGHADIQPGHRVLDAGCGIGGSAIWLAENRDAEVVGITPVPSQIRRGVRSVARRNLNHKIDLIRGDYSSIEYAENSFDVVWAMESLCHAPSKQDVYHEFFRVLKPGGRLVIAEYMRGGRPLEDDDEQLIHDWLRSWAIPDIDTDEEHFDAVSNAGFENIVNRDVTENVRPSLRRLYGMTLIGTPLDYLLKKLGFRRRSSNVVGAQKQYIALRKKIWHYSILTARKPY